METNATPSTVVIVPTGGGERFHRPGWLVFETACKTEFGHPARELPLAEAEQAGYPPCEKPACFGDTGDE